MSLIQLFNPKTEESTLEALLQLYIRMKEPTTSVTKSIVNRYPSFSTSLEFSSEGQKYHYTITLREGWAEWEGNRIMFIISKKDKVLCKYDIGLSPGQSWGGGGEAAGYVSPATTLSKKEAPSLEELYAEIAQRKLGYIPTDKSERQKLFTYIYNEFKEDIRDDLIRCMLSICYDKTSEQS